MLSMTHREAAIFDDACTVPTPCLLLPATAALNKKRVAINFGVVAYFSNKILFYSMSKRHKYQRCSMEIPYSMGNPQTEHLTHVIRGKSQTANCFIGSLRDQHINYAQHNRQCARTQHYNICRTNCPCAVKMTHACAMI